MPTRLTPALRSLRGQATLLVMMMMVSFIGFFTFVVYTGLLVHAKINLQNAADLAAYAGGAVQARQLNDISYLNYEMRRQYKKFLFRYYVLGGLAQKSYPNTVVDGNGLRVWTPDLNPNHNLQFPAVCITFNSNDNYCQVETLTKIPQVQSNPLDGITTVLSGVLKNLEGLRSKNCDAISFTNSQTLFYWLFNTDPTYQTIAQGLASAAAQGSTLNQNVLKNIKLIPGIAQGLGLIPRNILLSMRIKTLEFYLNSAPYRVGARGPMTLELANNLNSNAPDPGSHERALQAFYSAYNTLGTYLFNDQSITLEELLPEGVEGSNAARLIPLSTQFETYFMTMDQPENTDPNNPNDCRQVPKLIKLRDVPIGFSKDPTILTYYPVRLKAKVRLPFSPFRELELTAYSATQPFGSRIGPDFPNTSESKPWVNSSRKPPGLQCSDCFGVPNLPVEQGENIFEYGQGWNRGSVIRQMANQFGVFIPGCATGNNCTITAAGLEQIAQVAMAPNPPEKNYYNILNDLGASPDDPLHLTSGDPMEAPFDAQDLHSIRAPLISADQTGNDLQQKIRDAIDAASPGLSAAGVADPTTLQVFKDSFITYVNRLTTCEGQLTEDGECFKVVRLRNPFKTRPIGGASQSINSLSATFYMSSPTEVNSSWADVRNSDFKRRGRTGYSVKFVSFDTLNHPGKGGQFTNGPAASNPGTWTNLPFEDGEAQKDYLFLKH